MLGNRGLGEGHDSNNLAANAGAPAGKGLQNSQAGRVRKGFAGDSQSLEFLNVLCAFHYFIVYRRLTINKRAFAYWT